MMATLVHKPWPVAYARALGETSLRRAEQYFETSGKAGCIAT